VRFNVAAHFAQMVLEPATRGVEGFPDCDSEVIGCLFVD